jgi:hypothetical protein
MASAINDVLQIVLKDGMDMITLPTGIEAEDPMIKVRSEAYPVSYQRRTQHD